MQKATQFVKKYSRKYPLSLLCIAAIWYLCLLFNPPEMELTDVPLADKWVHFVMYGGTCSVIWWEYLRHHRQLDKRKLVLWALLGMIILGGVVELLQAYCTTTRSGEWLDFYADTVGVLLGNAIGILMKLIWWKGDGS